jgi:hypothetical protein
MDAKSIGTMANAAAILADSRASRRGLSKQNGLLSAIRRALTLPQYYVLRDSNDAPRYWKIIYESVPSVSEGSANLAGRRDPLSEMVYQVR